MAAKTPIAWIGLLLMAGTFGAGAQEATPSTTARPSDVEGTAWYEAAKGERNRVQLLKGYTCADPATSRIGPAEIGQVLGRFPAPKTPGYVPASRTHTAPMAAYPTEQLNVGNPGAALIMITIREDGSVEDARAACATDDTFADRARETALHNRYRAARLHDVPVASVVFQMVTYGVVAD